MAIRHFRHHKILENAYFMRVKRQTVSTCTVTGNSTVTSLTCNGSITGDDGKSVTIAGTDGTVFVQGTGKYMITTGSYNE